jgi:hypothetical protein
MRSTAKNRQGESREERKDGSALGGFSFFICQKELQEDYGIQRPLNFRSNLGAIKIPLD